MATSTLTEPGATEVDPDTLEHIPLRRLLILLAVEELQDSRIEHIHSATKLSCSQKTIRRDLAALVRQGAIGRTGRSGRMRYHALHITLI